MCLVFVFDYLFLFICFYSAILHERACLHSIEKTLKLSRKHQKYFWAIRIDLRLRCREFRFFTYFFSRILHYAMP